SRTLKSRNIFQLQTATLCWKVCGVSQTRDICTTCRSAIEIRPEHASNTCLTTPLAHALEVATVFIAALNVVKPQNATIMPQLLPSLPRRRQQQHLPALSTLAYQRTC